MKLFLSATYQPNEDEVWVDFRSTLDDDITVTLADELELNLKVQVVDQVGSSSYHTIANLKVSSDYALPDKNYELKFRNPPQKLDLWLEVSATFGITTVQKLVMVGQAAPSHISMDLPDNVLYGRDVFDMPETGDDEFVPNDNLVVLAPELRDFLVEYEFSITVQDTDYDLQYSGGGNRLWINNQNNQFEAQAVDQAPWDITAFAFLEPAANNLLPNPFFENVVNPTSEFDAYPAGYKVDAADSVMTQQVAFDYQITSAAKLWKLICRQNSISSGFNPIVIETEELVACAGLTSYVFSTYCQIKPRNKSTTLNQGKVFLEWYDVNEDLISSSQFNFEPGSFLNLDLLATEAYQSPSNAVWVKPVLQIGSLDSGDDVEVSLLGIQIEEGLYPTTRMKGPRAQDTLTVDDYNAANQKLRIQVIAGFDSGVDDRVLLQGPIEATFSGNELVVGVPDASTTLSVPFIFAAGEFLDLTIAHEAGKKLSVYREGTLVDETALPAFSTTVSPLTIFGVGGEFLKLSVFSRRGD